MNASMTSVTVTLLFLASVSPDSASAVSLNPGQVELTLSGSHVGSSLSSHGEDLVSGSATTISATLGYFVSPVLEVGGGFGFSRRSEKQEGEKGESDHSVSMGGDLILNLPNGSALLPFVDVGIGVVLYGGDAYGDETSLLLPSISGGLRSFVSESASVNISLGYARQTNIGGWEDLTADHFTAALGISVFFGGR